MWLHCDIKQELNTTAANNDAYISPLHINVYVYNQFVYGVARLWLFKQSVKVNLKQLW